MTSKKLKVTMMFSQKKVHKSLLINFIVMSITIIILLIIFEISLRFIYDDVCKIYEKEENDDMFLCYLSKYLPLSLNIYNQSTMRADEDMCDCWDPDLGWVPKDNCRSPNYSTNSQGFRGRTEFALEKEANRILILGNSFTWGENVHDDETYPYYLNKLFNEEVDVINMGVHGYGPDQMYIRFLRDGRQYDPDVVIMALFTPDVYRTTVKIRDYFKPKFNIENDMLVLDESANIPSIQEAIKIIDKKRSGSRFYSIVFFRSRTNILFKKLGLKKDIYSQDAFLITSKIIQELNIVSKEDGFEFFVLLIPMQEDVENSRPFAFEHNKLIDDLEHNNISYYTILPEFVAFYENTHCSLYHNAHLRPAGYQILASNLYNYIKNNTILPGINELV